MQTPARWTRFSTAFTPAAGACTRTRTWCSPRRCLIRRTPRCRCIRWPRRTRWPHTRFHLHTVRTRFSPASKGTPQPSTPGYYTDIGTWVTDFKVSLGSVAVLRTCGRKAGAALRILHRKTKYIKIIIIIIFRQLWSQSSRKHNYMKKIKYFLINVWF